MGSSTLGNGRSPESGRDASSVSIVVPKKFRRIATRGRTWGLPRSFPGYRADTSKQVLGAATKFVIGTDDPSLPEYLIKYPQKQHGKRETFTEFFINQFGIALGLNMAHSGLALADGVPVFVTRIFTGFDETLRHGSLIIEDCFKAKQAPGESELDRINKRTEQEFYSVDFVVSVLRTFCGDAFESIFPDFIDMLIFDSLIGSMDRHAQNWGILGRTVEPPGYRFAPIFDTARALLWSLDDIQVEKLSGDEVAFRAHIERARPCMGPERTHPKVNNCNHFEFVANLVRLYSESVTKSVQKLSNLAPERGAKILSEFPFDSYFTSTRKRLIVRIIAARADRLKEITQRGGN